jgi:hypothetical protein
VTHLRLFGRAFLIVLLTAANVRLIGRGLYPAAFVTGFGISFVWWLNTRTAAHSEVRGAQLVYSLGAAVGTMAGMWIGGRL